MALDYNDSTITDDLVQGEAKVTVYEIFKGLATNVGLLILAVILGLVISAFGLKMSKLLKGGK